MIKSNFGIENHGFTPTKNVYYNPSIAELMEFAVARNEGRLTDRGALAVRTGKRTGRSPNDKWVVKDAHTESTVCWGKVNQAITAEGFDRLHRLTLDHMNARDLFVTDAWVGADTEYGMPLRVVTTFAHRAAAISSNRSPKNPLLQMRTSSPGSRAWLIASSMSDDDVAAAMKRSFFV